MGSVINRSPIDLGNPFGFDDRVFGVVADTDNIVRLFSAHWITCPFLKIFMKPK